MITKRYLPPNLLLSFLKTLPSNIEQKVIGKSVEGQSIHLLQLGSGEKRIFMWSQMHGNESTSTKVIIDLLTQHSKEEITRLLKEVRLYIIPQLNPDGSQLYTRENKDMIDLNRDALALSAPESRILLDTFNHIRPHYCFNLHGQRTIYAAGKKGKSATLSFLAPSADEARTVTPARKEAMQLIAYMVENLQDSLSGQIGRYDDTFNPNCFGDSFSKENIPTLLFEAGHYPGDYQREKTRKFLYAALIIAINAIAFDKHLAIPVSNYFDIPENTVDFVDYIVAPVTIYHQGKRYTNQQLALQYREVLHNDTLYFQPYYHSFGTRLDLQAHSYIDASHLSKMKTINYNQDKIMDKEDLDELFSTF